MEYTNLGKTDIRISKICAGCMSFGEDSDRGWTLGEKESLDMVRTALGLGINFFDTANAYSHGKSEEYLGKAIKQLISRDKVVIATKVFFNEGHLSKAAINREIDASLKRLGTDYVDLYIVHRFDYDTPIEETVEALHRLVVAGKVRAIGASSMFGYQFMNMQFAAERNGWTKFSAMQNHYNLLYREEEREMLPICREQSVSITPYKSLASGKLCRPDWDADTPRGKSDPVAHAMYDAMKKTDIAIVKRVAELARKKDVPMTAVALRWLLEKGVSSVLIGSTKTSHLEDAVKAMDVSLSLDDMAYLEELYVPHPVVGADLPGNSLADQLRRK